MRRSEPIAARRPYPAWLFRLKAFTEFVIVFILFHTIGIHDVHYRISCFRRYRFLFVHMPAALPVNPAADHYADLWRGGNSDGPPCHRVKVGGLGCRGCLHVGTHRVYEYSRTGAHTRVLTRYAARRA